MNEKSTEQNKEKIGVSFYSPHHHHHHLVPYLQDNEAVGSGSEDEADGKITVDLEWCCKVPSLSPELSCTFLKSKQTFPNKNK